MIGLIRMCASKLTKIICLVVILTACITGKDSDSGRQSGRTPAVQSDIRISAGAVYYVDALGGNDSNAGTQWLPWRTIQNAADRMTAGDKAIVKGGVYNERIGQTASGGPGQEIVFQADEGETVTCKGFTISGSYVTVDGFRVDADDDHPVRGKGFYVSGDYVTVKNGYVTECPHGGILYDQNSSYGSITGNRCYHNGQNGMDIRGSHHVIENNEIWESVQHHPQAPSLGGADADGVRFHGDHHVFRGNWIHEPALPGDPYNTSPHTDCFQTFDGSSYGAPAASYCVFENNRCRHYITGMYTFMIEGSSSCPAHDLTFKNNIFEVAAGINVNSYGGGNAYNVSIHNNTFVGSPSFSGYWIAAIYAENVNTIEVKNNITIDYRNGGVHRALDNCTNLSVDHNCAYNTDSSVPSARPSAQGHELWAADPGFVDYPGRDFHLQSGSPCVDAGASIPGNAVDFDGNPRPAGASWDIGAYEISADAGLLSANVAASPVSGRAPLTVNFSGGAGGGQSPYAYHWAFGDGQTSVAQNPSHTYSAAGKFTATLTVTDGASMTAKASENIDVAAAPLTAHCQASMTSGQSPLTVNFMGSAGGGVSPYKYHWTFGDGQTSTLQNPSHTYAKAGEFKVALSVTDSASATASSSLIITVSTVPVLGATAKASPASGPAPLAVNFAGAASGGKSPYAYKWDFGDGQTSTLQNPPHTYTKAGKFTATVAVTDSASTVSKATVGLSVTAATTLGATAKASPTSGPAPLAVNFIGSASGGKSPYKYKWSFGDGQTSTLQNPAHIYPTAGNVIAVLTVIDSASATCKASITLSVTAAASLTASAAADVTAGQAPLKVNFFGGAGGGVPPCSYRWDFGDGQPPSTSQNASHNYPSAGDYTAVLTVTDAAGAADSKSLAIHVASKKKT